MMKRTHLGRPKRKEDTGPLPLQIRFAPAVEFKSEWRQGCGHSALKKLDPLSSYFNKRITNDCRIDPRPPLIPKRSDEMFCTTGVPDDRSL
jgi:hypothetical protein